jgi:hypothetical protein
VGYVGGGAQVVAGIQVKKRPLFVEVHASIGGVDAIPVRVSVGYVVKSLARR